MNDTIVLCYHAVSADWPAALSVTPERFTAQLQLLRDRGYRSVTFTEAVTDPARGRKVAVTFDDGYRSVLEVAKPIIDRLGFVATLYVPTAYIGQDGPMAWAGIDQWLGTPHEPELTPLAWDELRGLHEDGWEIGAHTCTHPRLTKLPDDRLAAELGGAKAVVEQHLGVPCRSVAYPYGDVDARVVSAAGKAGFTTGASLPDRVHARRRLDWPRVGVYHGDHQDRYRRKISRSLRMLQRTPAWPAVAYVVRRRGRPASVEKLG